MLKRSIFLSICLVMAVNLSQAQLRLIYNETFLSNKGKWPVSNDAETVFEVKEGHYSLNHKGTGSRWVYSYPDINPRTYYIIEIKLKVTSGNSDDQAVGVVWNVDDNNRNLFSWYRNGEVYVSKKVDGTKTDLLEGKTTKKIINDQYHTIKVKSFSNRTEYYVDDEMVLKGDKLTYKFGNGVGVFLEATGTTAVDHIKIYQEREPLNLIETDFNVTNKENLGKGINTFYNEVQPVISHDGKTLYFTRKEYPKNTGNSNDDIWYSQRDANNVFSTSENLGRPVNNTDYNSVAGFSADGKKMVVAGKYNSSGAYIGDGYCEFTLTDKGWGDPKNLNIKNFYNTNVHQEASYSPDGTVMIFTIERRDTYGGKDLYVSLKQADGTWSAPFNAGKTVNSFADEISPFLAGDNKTLYFASEGHTGYGESDVFMTRRLDDTWKNWSKPVNMGPKINSSEWDAYFTIDAKGEWAYMVSTHHSIGKADLFRFKIPKELRPDSVAAQIVLEKVIKKEEVLVKVDTIHHSDSTTIIQHTETVLKNTDTILEKSLEHEHFLARLYGKCYDAETKKVLPAPIVIRNIETHHEIYSDGGDVNGFDVVVEEGIKYEVYANYTGYIAEAVAVDLTTIHGNYEKEVQVYLKKFKKDQSVVMNNIFFEEKHTNLRYDSRGELTRVVSIMKENPNMKILIGGHTQMNDADPKYNKKLSEERAKAVYDELVKMGVDKKRMTYKGFGHDKPAYDVNSMWENAKNRRVDFTIVSL